MTPKHIPILGRGDAMRVALDAYDAAKSVAAFILWSVGISWLIGILWWTVSEDNWWLAALLITLSALTGGLAWWVGRRKPSTPIDSGTTTDGEPDFQTTETEVSLASNAFRYLVEAAPPELWLEGSVPESTAPEGRLTLISLWADSVTLLAWRSLLDHGLHETSLPRAMVLVSTAENWPTISHELRDEIGKALTRYGMATDVMHQAELAYLEAIRGCVVDVQKHLKFRPLDRRAAVKLSKAASAEVDSEGTVQLV